MSIHFQGTNLRRVRTLPALVLPLAGWLVACDCNQPVRVVVSQVSGEAMVRSPSRATRPARPGMRLSSKDIVSTGPTSTMVVELIGGRLSIGPVTVLNVDTQRDIPRVSVLGGSFSVKAANPRVFELSFPLGRIVPTAVPFDMTVDPLKGQLKITSGAGQLIEPDGRQTLLRVGQTMLKAPALAGGSMNAPWRTSGLVLLSPYGQTRLRRHGETTFQKPPREEFITLGTEIRTGKREAILQYLNRDQIFVSADTLLAFPRTTTTSEQDPFGRYRLEQGRIEIIGYCQKASDKHHVVVGNHTALLTCTRERMAITIERRRGRAWIEVHHGQATLDKKRTIRAGMKLDLVDMSAAPLVENGVAARTEMKTIVFTHEPTVPVKFSIDPRDGLASRTSSTFVVQLSKAERFENVIWEQETAGPQLLVARVPAGQYRFRFKLLDDPLQVRKGDLVIGPQAHVSSDAAIQTIRAEGAPAALFYREQLPVIEFSWAGALGKSGHTQPSGKSPGPVKPSYELVVYSSLNLDVPYLARKTAAERYRIASPAEELGEGTYYWYVHSLAADGTRHRVTRPFRFSVAFDRAATTIELSQPREGALVGRQVAVRGSTPHRFDVKVNGLETKGVPGTDQFERTISLTPGPATIFVAATDARRKEAYWLVRSFRVKP